MQRPESPTLFVLLLILGFVTMTAVGVACHLLARRIILGASHRALKILVPPILFISVLAVFICLPASLSIFYSARYGYLLLPGEAPGPLEGSGDFIASLLGLPALVALFGYSVYLLIQFFRLWLPDFFGE